MAPERGSATTAGEGPRSRSTTRARRAAVALAALCGVCGCTGATGTAGPPAPTSAAASGVARPPAAGVRIDLPELLAVELPAPERPQVGPAESPLRELLAAAAAGGLSVTHDLARPVGAGATDVTWTAWAGAPGQSPVRATRTERIHVFPFGQAPVGLSGDDRATVGNQSPKVVRDATGRAHMVWLDSFRPGRGSHVMYRRARVDGATAAVTWETGPIRVSESGSSYPVLDVSGSTVHIAWASSTTVRYRRLVATAQGWTLEPIRDTRVGGPGEDWGPGLAARGEAEVHLLTPRGRYAVSTDGGRTWTAERVPVPPSLIMKAPALALDSGGSAHVTFTGKVRSPAGGWMFGKQHGAYWQLQYVRRRSNGGWEDAHNVLAEYPEWADRRSQADILADFIDVAVDRAGNIHVAWHGSANTAAYGFDEAFYVRRRAVGPGRWGPWESVQSLHPIDRARGDFYSYAPSLAVDDESDVVLATLFFNVIPDYDGRYDAVARVLRGGRLDGPAIPLTRAARDGVKAGHPEAAWSTWFPVSGPRLVRGPGGRAWVDILQTIVTSPGKNAAPHYVVYQRLDVAARVPAAR